ncbi:MAG: hypothetical protein ACD_30C00104G0003 [uncultured bacterium]|nr:MAG: hypothetical protein ACD_30C00104G0003 [uncultured bacterium]
MLLSSEIFCSTSVLTSALTLSPASFKLFSAVYKIVSALFLVSISSFFFLSSSAWASASLVILSTSSLSSPVEPVIVIFCSLPDALSLAETFKIPEASISKVTSTCGTPLGAGGIPSKINFPKDLLSLAICLSPWSTLISTEVWLSAAVENTSDFEDGIVVFLVIKGVDTPPKVSIPKVKGVTSKSKTSLTSPPKTPPWIAAPIATTSSGLIPLCGSLPKKS